MTSSRRSRNWKVRAARAAITGTLAACAMTGLTGCTMQGSTPTPTASRVVPLGTTYGSGKCLSSSLVSEALGLTVTFTSGNLRGYEFDCNYRGPGTSAVQVSYSWNDHATAASTKHQLDGLVGGPNVTSVAIAGAVAWEVRLTGGLSVIGLAHGYTVSVLATGATPTGEVRLERDTVAGWSR